MRVGHNPAKQMIGDITEEKKSYKNHCSLGVLDFFQRVIYHD